MTAGGARRVFTNVGPTLGAIFTSGSSAWRLKVMRSRVELFEQIRRDRRIEGLSIRELAERHSVHRRTVRQALASPLPPPRKQYPLRPRPAIEAYVEIVDGWLVADREVPKKQRHTARRIWQRLVAEHGATCSEVTVSRYVACGESSSASRPLKWRYRRLMNRARRPKSTSVSSGPTLPASWLSAGCSSCGCAALAGPST
jgi:hypothetical protein